MASIFGTKSTARTTAGRVPLLALVGSKGGPDGGRPFPPLEAGAMPASDLHMAGAGNPLLAAIQGAPGQATMDQRARRRLPDALARRASRAKYAEQNQLASPDWRTWDAAHVKAAQDLQILPGGENFGHREFGGDAAPDVNVGRQLANIRWHGHPDGPADPNDLAAQVNALRAAARRPQTYATRS